jgi:hypothetical protein
VTGGEGRTSRNSDLEDLLLVFLVRILCPRPGALFLQVEEQKKRSYTSRKNDRIVFKPKTKQPSRSRSTIDYHQHYHCPEGEYAIRI